MSLTLKETLASLALGQVLMVVPALKDDYQGKTAATIAAMLLMLSADVETIADRRTATRSRLLAFLSEVAVDDPALRQDVALLLAEAGAQSLDNQYWQLLSILTLVHAWADDHDMALAARCRRFLAEWSESEKLAPPAIALG